MKREESYMGQLVKYIKNNLSKGYTSESLKWALINQGHSKIEVNRAMGIANEELAEEAPILKEKPVIKVETIPAVEEEKTFWNTIKNIFKIK